MTSTAEGTRKVVQVNGHDVAYHDVGDGVPVVFLHGSGPGKESARALTEASGNRLVTADFNRPKGFPCGNRW